MLQIDDTTFIDESEFGFEFARSSGPGGQNVNKVETKVTLLFDVRGTQSLSAFQRELVENRLGTRITKAGVLRITSQRHRTREANRRAAIDRFVELLAAALVEEEPRRPTRVPAGERRRRRANKVKRSQKKALRARPDVED